MVILNWLLYHLCSRKKIILTKEAMGQLAYYHMCKKSLKDTLLIKPDAFMIVKFPSFL